MAAANLSDSSHVFERRLQTLGFPDDFKKAFKDSGLSNLGSFAFAVAPPGQAATDDKVNEFIARVMPAGRRATLGEATSAPGCLKVTNFVIWLPTNALRAARR